MSESIKVFIRCRPLNKKEIAMKSPGIVEFQSNQIKVKDKSFTFDHVFGTESTQNQIFDNISSNIDAIIDGYNSTIFVYGQTSSGKTFTMQGIPEMTELRGIIPNTFAYIFNKIKELNSQFLIRCSFLELYNEDLHDLLLKDKPVLELKEYPDKTVYVKDLTSVPVHSPEDMDKLMKTGNMLRSVASTNMNDESSRSHCVFTVTVEQLMDNQTVKVGKLNLVDLAGSERQSKTGATGDRLKEGAKINLSLSNLGNVISSLVENKPHVPYRDSKLTRLLQDALGGNSKTIMIATISPADYNYEETLSTLKYANRAKNIKNKPKINEDPKDTKIREYQEEIQRIKTKLQQSSTIEKSAEDISDEVLKNVESETNELIQKLEEMKSNILQKPKSLPPQEVKESDKVKRAKENLEDHNKRNESLAKEIQILENEKSIFENKYSSMVEQVKDYRRKLQELEKQKEAANADIVAMKYDFDIRVVRSKKVYADSVRDLECKQKIFDNMPKSYLESTLQRINSKLEVEEFYRLNPIEKPRLLDTSTPKYSEIMTNTKERISTYLMHGTVEAIDPLKMESMFVYLPQSSVKHLDYQE
eukprot:NODE_411_length_9170_cov_0.431154.p1 type:complete len:588 gc:universal NODE_411_length_9170_cov_0.431154:3425-1662(-)